MTPAAAMTPKPKKSSAMEPAAPAAGAFAAEAEAKAHCPSDTVVWVNTHSHKYHFAGNKSYGTTKSGSYMCEADAKTAGNVAAKDEKPK
ncbi:MAG: signal protein [Bradyrhizobium sp.]|nr:MAG: signal protein [Bradyrhizobium sp.]